MSLECFEKLNLFALELFAVRSNFVYITNGRSHSASFCRGGHERSQDERGHRDAIRRPT